MKYDSKTGRLLKAQRLTADVYDFILDCPELAAKALPGQFAQIRLPGHTLRRPISICGIDREKGTLRFVFQIRGRGTAELAEFRQGQELEILAPLGNGFPVDPDKRTLLIGGGIGVPPLLGCAAKLKENAVAVLGFRSKNAVILEQDFKAAGAKTLVATDDGSYGFHGLVTELAEREEFQMVFACGPSPMLKAAAKLAESRNVPCFLSLEERMACGIGACLGCAVRLRYAQTDPKFLSEELEEKQEAQTDPKFPFGELDTKKGARTTPKLPDGQKLSNGQFVTKETLPPDGWYYGHVCKDGPVFDSRRVVL